MPPTPDGGRVGHTVGMRALTVHHVSVNVADLDEGIIFYGTTLGLPRRGDRPGDIGPGAWFDSGDRQVHLLPAPAPESRGQHVALLVADLDAERAGLLDAGVQVSEPFPIGGNRQAFLTDPWGNVIELHELGA